uniref:MPN domain-containing protein n=1 Tax=Mesocestoides corti TaxID=53468 RepID=A0A5K3ETZ2_MESCO
SRTSGAFHPSPPRWPRRSLYTASHPCPSLVGCLPFPHAIGSQRDTGLAEARWSNMSAPQSDATPHHTTPHYTSICASSVLLFRLCWIYFWNSVFIMCYLEAAGTRVAFVSVTCFRHSSHIIYYFQSKSL